jgi:hypothetical protein
MKGKSKMTDLEIRKTLLPGFSSDVTFVVNEFPRIQIPPKPKLDPDKFQDLRRSERQMLMERLIDKVKDI